MRPAKLIEIKEEIRVHDLTELLLHSGKSEIVIGRRDSTPYSNQADILLGENEKGEPNAAVFVIRGISRRQAVIGYDPQENGYYIKDCSTHGTTKINSECLLRGEKRTLKRGARLFFGNWNYGPITFVQDF